MRRALVLGAMLIVSAIGLTAQEDVARFEGRPIFREGFDRGYYVWHDGNEWHVRWTTNGRLLNFTGQVIADGGKITDLHRVDVERESKVVRTGSRRVAVRGPRGRVHTESRPTTAIVTKEQDKIEKDGDRAIRFRAKTDADIDGFDFKPDRNVSALRFVLEIEGQSRAIDVEVGRANAKAGGNPFTVNLK
jgi:hypothetical protein